MKLVVINLEKSKDRLYKISKNLNNLEIPFERFDAIYGKELDNDTIEENTSLIGRTLLCNHGIIGCAMSHIAIWKEFYKDREEGNDFILISEDDIEYNKIFPKIFENVENLYTELKFDILSINSSIGLLFNKSGFSTIQMLGYEITKPFFPLTTASYIISRKGVSKLLKSIKIINYHIDFEIALRNLNLNIKEDNDEFEYYNIKYPELLEVSKEVESNISPNKKGIFGTVLQNMGFHKLNWCLGNSAIVLFLENSVSIYTLILIIILITLLIIYLFTKRMHYIIGLVILLELILIM